MSKEIKKVICSMLLIVGAFLLVGCVGNPEEDLLKSIDNCNYDKAVKIYNTKILGTNQETEINKIVENEIYNIVKEWDCEEENVENAVNYLNILSTLENSTLANLAIDCSNLVRVEGTGRILHVQAEEFYADDKLAEAMNCVLEMDMSYSQYENAKELYDISEKILLETVSMPYSSKDCITFIEQLDGYLEIVENEKFSKRKIELEGLIDEYVFAEKTVENAAQLYDKGDYIQCFDALQTAIDKYPDNNLLTLALDNSYELYKIDVVQSVLELCENEEYSDALDEIEIAKGIYSCEAFDTLEESVKKQKSFIYRITSNIVDKFKAFTQDSNGETLSVKEIGSKAGAYVIKSGKKLFLGDYTDEDVTVLSFTGDVVSSVAGVDVMMDLRDVSYDLTHWGEDEYFMVRLATDTIALVPVIGAIKYFDFKSFEKTVDVLKSSGKVIDVADTVVDTTKKYENIGEAVDNSKELTIFSNVKNKYVRYVSKPTINARYAGKVHPLGIKFDEKKLKYSDGRKIVGVFPEFESSYNVRLDKSIYTEPRETHFKYCNEQLQKAIKADPKLRARFTQEQIEEIENGIKSGAPTGWTWHHNEEEGLIQLVSSEIHSSVGHTGGDSLWGAGSVANAA